MPYIVDRKRRALDPAIDELMTALRGLQLDDENDNLEGNLNYVVSTILSRLYNGGYRDINAAMGLLASIQAEYYRKHAAPVENQKEHDNGPVYGQQ